MSDASKIDDGGAAFPVQSRGSDGLPDRSANLGLTKREYIATAAMTAFLSQSHAGPKDWTAMGHGWGEDCANDLNKNSNVVLSTLATFSFKVADALIAASKSSETGHE